MLTDCGLKLCVIANCKLWCDIELVVYTGSLLRNGQEERHFWLNFHSSYEIPFPQKAYFFVDNWYTGPALFGKLLKHNTGLCGIA